MRAEERRERRRIRGLTRAIARLKVRERAVLAQAADEAWERRVMGAERRLVEGVVPPIWAPGVLVGAVGHGEDGHWCAGKDERVAGSRVVVARSPRPTSAAGVGAEKAVSWEKCGECEGLPELRVAGVVILDTPGSELELKRWPWESRSRGSGSRWIFQDLEPKRLAPYARNGRPAGWQWSPKQRRADVRPREGVA